MKQIKYLAEVDRGGLEKLRRYLGNHQDAIQSSLDEITNNGTVQTPSSELIEMVLNLFLIEKTKNDATTND